MALFAWTADLVTGNNLMDTDHTRLAEKVNALLESIDINHGQPSNYMRALLDDLIDFTREHFEREEAEMWRIAYAGTGAHRADHVALLVNIIEFRSALDARERINGVGVQNFLNKWWQNHILSADMKLAAALRGPTDTVRMPPAQVVSV